MVAADGQHSRQGTNPKRAFTYLLLCQRTVVGRHPAIFGLIITEERIFVKGSLPPPYRSALAMHWMWIGHNIAKTIAEQSGNLARL